MLVDPCTQCNLTNLFKKTSPSLLCPSVTLICLSQHWVERFGATVCRGAISRASKGSDVCRLLESVLASGGTVKKVGISQLFRHTLQHGKGLTEMNLARSKKSYTQSATENKSTSSHHITYCTMQCMQSTTTRKKANNIQPMETSSFQQVYPSVACLTHLHSLQYMQP